MAASHLKLNLDLGDSFVEELLQVMDDELEVASRKWGYYPSKAEAEELRKHAIAQVRLRINSVSNDNWDLSSTVRFSMPGPRKEIAIPGPESDASAVKIIRSRDGWLIDQDKNEGAIALRDFPDIFRNEVFAWARTAVFYSVGSYKV